jgi:hypothetical protein
VASQRAGPGSEYPGRVVGTTGTLATSLRGARDRNDSPRVSGSCARFQRVLAVLVYEVIRDVLSRIPDAPCIKQGLAGIAAMCNHRNWEGSNRSRKSAVSIIDTNGVQPDCSEPIPPQVTKLQWRDSTAIDSPRPDVARRPQPSQSNSRSRSDIGVATCVHMKFTRPTGVSILAPPLNWSLTMAPPESGTIAVLAEKAFGRTRYRSRARRDQ